MELMIVVGILSIIAAITVPNLLSTRKRSQEGVAVANIRSIGTAEVLYWSSAEETNAGGAAIYGDFSDLTNAPTTGVSYLDSTWDSTPIRGSYAYVVTPVDGPPSTFAVTTGADDTATMRSFRTDESAAIVGKLGGIPSDITDGLPIN